MSKNETHSFLVPAFIIMVRVKGMLGMYLKISAKHEFFNPKEGLRV